MTDNTNDLEEFGEQLRRVKADTRFEFGEVARTTVYDDALGITWALASGREVYTEYDLPDEWSPASSRLVTLMEYWDLDPTDLDLLEDPDLSHEIPVRYDQGEESWRPDWQTIERQLAEVNDDGE